MTTTEILDRLKDNSGIGFQLTKRNGLLKTTWLIYLKKDEYYYFDISEKIIFDENHKYSEEDFLEEFENSYFEIDCEISSL